MFPYFPQEICGISSLELAWSQMVPCGGRLRGFLCPRILCNVNRVQRHVLEHGCQQLSALLALCRDAGIRTGSHNLGMSNQDYGYSGACQAA